MTDRNTAFLLSTIYAFYFEGEYIRAQKESEGVSAELILINK